MKSKEQKRKEALARRKTDKWLYEKFLSEAYNSPDRIQELQAKIQICERDIRNLNNKLGMEHTKLTS